VQAAYVPVQTSVSGKVSALSGSCPSITGTIGGKTVTTSAQTDFGKKSCDKVKNNNDVDVTGLLQADGSIQATTFAAK
jgi:hypothetical protein